ncbi:MAG: ABC transporter permease, partial [Alphaproteobacteria bacterium]|nr:ABC transporter permease [Alphaproteobacteria bacterium]
IITFFGKVCVNAVARQSQRAALPWRSVFYHIYEIGVRGLPIVCLLSFLISIVLGYQGAVQLRKFGASIFTINLVAISMLREMGVVITSIIVAGRTGSAFAAELGVMKVNQEIDALATFGLEPFRLLVLPRLLAIMIAVPILVFFADCAGLIGTLVAGLTELNLTFLECTNRMRDIITTHTFMIGLVKAPVFACLIGLTGCMQGLSVKDSAEEIGLHTTAAVVQSIFLVIAFDAMFSVIFTMLDL